MQKPGVGQYLNEHFVSTFQKVGTFRIVNGNKQGGNVASYFCTPDSRVLHAIAGPVDGETLIREARWVIENWKLAQLNNANDLTRLMAFYRRAHSERLHRDYHVEMKRMTFPSFDSTAAMLATAFDPTANGRKQADPFVRWSKLGKQGKVHQLLAAYPLVKVGQVYQLVFEKILDEEISTLPVARKN